MGFSRRRAKQPTEALASLLVVPHHCEQVAPSAQEIEERENQGRVANFMLRKCVERPSFPQLRPLSTLTLHGKITLWIAPQSYPFRRIPRPFQRHLMLNRLPSLYVIFFSMCSDIRPIVLNRRHALCAKHSGSGAPKQRDKIHLASPQRHRP